MKPSKTIYDPRDQLWKDYTTKDARAVEFAGVSRTTPLPSSLTSTGSSLKSTAKPIWVAETKGGGDAWKNARVWQSQESEVNPSARPPFLNKAGKWVQEKLPDMVVESQAQPLTAPGAFTATGTLRGSQLAEGPKAIAAVHSYADVSPAVNTECAHDARGWSTHTHKTWDPTVQKLRTARLHDPAAVATARVHLSGGQEAMLSSSFTKTQAHLLKPSGTLPPTTASLAAARTQGRVVTAPGVTETVGAREASINNFWQRASGSGGSNGSGGGGGQWKLGIPDLARTLDDVSYRAVPASHNARLVGSRWRYTERPVVGQALYTDYYGPVAGGKEGGDYYGRSWHHVPQ